MRDDKGRFIVGHQETENEKLKRIEGMRNSWKNRKDYNVVPCCYECNCARNRNLSFEEMVILGKTIAQIKKNRLENG